MGISTNKKPAHHDGAAPQDKVKAEALRFRVRYNEGKDKCGNSTNSQNPDAPTVKPVAPCSIAEQVLEKVTKGKTISQASREVAAA
jgi:hypothetical protein